MVEIGPGRGALTRYLLPLTDNLHAVEIDGSLVYRLHSEFAGNLNFHAHHSDVLETNLAQWGPAVITGNLPYYITSPIIEKFLALDGGFRRAVFLMQWEVAERLLASPHSRDYGYLSVITRLVCDVSLVIKVPPSAFRPPPKVDSAGVLFQRRDQYPRNLPDIRTFVGRCFAHKRKTLRNNLRPYYGQAIDALPEASMRAEELAPEQFVRLWETIAASTPK